MKALKIAAIVTLIYMGSVTAFESLLGYLQPTGEPGLRRTLHGSTLVITTFDRDGTAHDRVVSRIRTDGHLYVAANHWPRAWYRRALANPDVQITMDGEKRDYRAVPVTGAEHYRVDRARRLGIGVRILTGFPPRHFLRLEPR